MRGQQSTKIERVLQIKDGAAATMAEYTNKAKEIIAEIRAAHRIAVAYLHQRVLASFARSTWVRGERQPSIADRRVATSAARNTRAA